MQIRNYKTSSEVRRVVKSLKNALSFDRARLASVRRSINIASLHEETAAPRAAAKKPVSKTPVKKTAAKPAAKTPTRAPAKTGRAMDDGILNTRGGRGPSAPVRKRCAVSSRNVEKLTGLLSTRQDRLQIAEHIRQLLVHHFDKTDKTVVRLVKVVDALVRDSQQLFNETEKTLNDMSSRSIADDFTATVDEITEALKERFDDRYRAFTVKYSMAVKNGAPVKKGAEPGEGRTYHIAYLMFDDLQGSSSTQDYVVVLTRVTENGKERDFVRTLTDYRSPAWIVKHSPGLEFADTKRALRIIYNTMSMEDMLDVAEQAELPVKRAQVNYKNPNVADLDIDEKAGQIKVFLKPGIDEAKAKRLLIDLFAETKALVKAVHPRYKNPVKAFQPKLVKKKVKSKTTGKVKVVEQWVIAFAFAKLQGDDAPVQLPRDKVKQFMDTFEIDDPETVLDFNKLLRNFLGAR